MKEISETSLIIFDIKRKVDSEKFRAMQMINWDQIKTTFLSKRDEIKSCVNENFDLLKNVSDS